MLHCAASDRIRCARHTRKWHGDFDQDNYPDPFDLSSHAIPRRWRRPVGIVNQLLRANRCRQWRKQDGRKPIPFPGISPPSTGMSPTARSNKALKEIRKLMKREDELRAA
jgi:hypothetical protein